MVLNLLIFNILQTRSWNRQIYNDNRINIGSIMFNAAKQSLLFGYIFGYITFARWICLPVIKIYNQIVIANDTGRSTTIFILTITAHEALVSVVYRNHVHDNIHFNTSSTPSIYYCVCLQSCDDKEESNSTTQTLFSIFNRVIFSTIPVIAYDCGHGRQQCSWFIYTLTQAVCDIKAVRWISTLTRRISWRKSTFVQIVVPPLHCLLNHCVGHCWVVFSRSLA